MGTVSFDTVLLISVVSVVTTAAAVALAHWGRTVSMNPVIAPGVAAGVMVWLALGQVAPDSVAANGLRVTAVAMSLGAVAVAVLGRVVARTLRWGAGVAPLIGFALALHDVPEGFAVAALASGGGPRRGRRWRDDARGGGRLVATARSRGMPGAFVCRRRGRWGGSDGRVGPGVAGLMHGPPRPLGVAPRHPSSI